MKKNEKKKKMNNNNNKNNNNNNNSNKKKKMNDRNIRRIRRKGIRRRISKTISKRGKGI